jgi:DNA replication and repair protein RecF
MQLHSLYLKDFRSYKNARVYFSPRINNIFGPNAHGKTNLLEALYFLVIGRSFRTKNISDLIRYGADCFHIEALFVKNGIEQKIAVTADASRRKIVHNNTQYSSFNTLLGLLQGVILSPEDQALISGAPALRRRYLDIQLSQVNPLYVHHLGRYHRAMKQRNQLLRLKKSQSIEIFEEEMARSAEYIVSERRKVITTLAQRGLVFQSELSRGLDKLSLAYRSHAPNCSLMNYYQTQFREQRNREFILGNTLTGPHRDDMDIAIHEREARAFASEGQKNCCAISLRLAEWYRLKEVANELPLMAVDDMGAPLDSARKEEIFQQLDSLGQVFVTSTDRLNQATVNHIDVRDI